MQCKMADLPCQHNIVKNKLTQQSVMKEKDWQQYKYKDPELT